jgi:hypothetical protein
MPRKRIGDPAASTIKLPCTLRAPCLSTTDPAGVGDGGVGGVGDGGGEGGVGDGGGEGGDGGEGTDPQLGLGALGSKVPVHSSQLDAESWHHPVSSSPQSPQSAPNLQQPPPPPGGEGEGEGEGSDPPHQFPPHCPQMLEDCEQYSPGALQPVHPPP